MRGAVREGENAKSGRVRGLVLVARTFKGDPADEWKARLRHPGVPREALPPALKRTFDAGEVAKERFRRASSLGPGLTPLGAENLGSKAKVTPE